MFSVQAWQNCLDGKRTEYQVVAKYADQVVGSRVSTEFRQYGDPPEFSTSVLPNFRRNWHSIPRSSSKFRKEDFSWNFYGILQNFVYGILNVSASLELSYIDRFTYANFDIF